MLGNPEVRKRDRAVTRHIHKIMWEASFQDKKNLFGSLVLRWPANVVADILLPLYVAYGLEHLVNNNYQAVQSDAFIIIGFGILYGVLWGLGGILVCRAAANAAEYIQKKIFQNYLEKDYEFYSDSYVGALGAQANRMREALNEYNQIFILYGPRIFIVVVLSIVIIALHSLLLAFVTFLCMSVVLSYTLISSRWRLHYRRKLSQQSSHLAGLIGDSLGHGETVKSFARETFETKQLSKALEPWRQAQYKAWLTSIPADIGRTLLAAITVAVLLLTTMYLYRRGEIDLTLVALVQLYVIKMITATNEISNRIKEYESTMGSIYQAVQTMLVPKTVKDPITPRQVNQKDQFDITFKAVSFHYKTAQVKRMAVAKFSLSIQAGERVGLVGYSGSGKTTLTKLLMRFMDTTSGTISLNGIKVQDLAQTDLRNLIAYVPQEPLLFHRTVWDNISYGKPSAKRPAIETAAKAAYVTEFLGELPNGFNSLVGERGIKLSGGQRQRVAIARALVKDAPILILDEATSSLDSKSEHFIQQALWKLMENRTALVIAHRLSTIQRMDRIVVMDKGKIVQIGTHQELKDQPGIYADLWRHQSGGYIGVAHN